MQECNLDQRRPDCWKHVSGQVMISSILEASRAVPYLLAFLFFCFAIAIFSFAGFALAASLSLLQATHITA
jgi:hypothetical protein